MVIQSVNERPSFSVKINEALCKGCLLCVYACNELGGRSLAESDKKTVLGGGLPSLKGRCTGCRICERFCPDFSISVEEN